MDARKRTSYRVALGGIVSALCLTVMFLPGILPAFYIASPMTAGILMLILAEEVSRGWGWLTYFAVSLLSLLVIPDKEAALMFILFFGYYPLLRAVFEKIRLKLLRVTAKLLLFNGCLVLDYLLTVYVLGLPTFADTAPWMYAALLLGANIIFLFYERLLSQLGWFYRKVIVSRLFGRRP